MKQQLLNMAFQSAEKGYAPDFIIRQGIRRLCKKRLEQEGRYAPELAPQQYMQVLQSLKQSPMAVETDKANEQHYEVPTAFFQKVLGKHLKYSASYFATEETSLDKAEADSLQIYSERAQLANGQNILELGCGWGSFTLWIASQYPEAQITGVSNSSTQRTYILEQAQLRGLNNIEILTQDINTLTFEEGLFDRVVSVEMFEHVRNYQGLFQNISSWLKTDGLLWCHIFCHRFLHYPFEVIDDDDWMSKYFFSGGVMPAASTFLNFQEHLTIKNQWQWSGTHYQQTAEAWLDNMDKHKEALEPLFKETYKTDADIWWQRWRIFFMACAELFGYENGQEWVVGHYLFEKK